MGQRPPVGNTIKAKAHTSGSTQPSSTCLINSNSCLFAALGNAFIHLGCKSSMPSPVFLLDLTRATFTSSICKVGSCLKTSLAFGLNLCSGSSNLFLFSVFLVHKTSQGSDLLWMASCGELHCLPSIPFRSEVLGVPPLKTWAPRAPSRIALQTHSFRDRLFE
jgi:hypothetical protein